MDAPIRLRAVRIRTLCRAWLLLVALAAPARADYDLQRLSRLLNEALSAHNDRRAILSAHVVDLADGRTLFEFSADTPLIPASVHKVIACSAALNKLGPQFQFSTRLAISDQDLVLVGDGDPTLGDPKLAKARGAAEAGSAFDHWAAALLSANIRRIPGRLLVDDSIFDDTLVHPSWPTDQFQEWYEAPIGGLNFADNCVEVDLTPGARGSTPLLALVPPNSFMTLLDRTQPAGRAGLAARRPRDSSQIIVTGTASRAAHLGPITVSDPGLFTAAALRAALAERGITIAGPTERRRVTDDARRLLPGFRELDAARAPIADAVGRACTDSLGMMAECLFKRTGCAPGRTGSWSSGAIEVMAYLRSIGVRDDAFVIDDGSGLSRRNRVSARAVTTVLAAAARGPAASLLYQSLAEAGVSGTLRRRFRTPQLAGRIRAKTGYINGVRTLAGYVDTRDGHRLAFAFLYNGTPNTSKLTHCQDAACSILASLPDIADASVPAAATRPATKPAKRRTPASAARK
ncbi:MAG: D-alanyl-D-alanine carboxypeptidase/D-alanyl-D-alanine-endopeptidase [Phycisphaerae bacterium]